ncbi:MAG: PqiC family protein, partial [Candidatus Binataceae bacterium]
MAALAVLAFPACGSSPPARYYTLDPIEPAAIATSVSNVTPVMIDKVLLPPALDRPQIVRRIAANRLDLDETDRWAASLDDIVQLVLAEDLAARMAPGEVIQPGEPLPSGPMRCVVVDLAAFEGDLSGHIVLRAQWTTEGGGDFPARVAHDEDI